MTSPRPAVALVPAFNEAARIAVTIESLRMRPEVGKIYVVDDGSSDGTAARARDAGADVVIEQKNGGKGAALATAYAAARGEGEIFLLLDADLGASAAECVKLLPPIWDGRADMTIGLLPPDPDFAESGQTGGMGFVVRLARNGIRKKTGQTFQQPLSGQRAVTRELLEKLGGKFASGFGVEVRLTIDALAAGCKLVEVPTYFRHHVTGGDWEDIRHRARQFRDVARVVWG